MKIEGHQQVDVKRFYIPFSFVSKCPKCGIEKEIDLSQDYLSYPTLNCEHDIYVYCEVCGKEYYEQVVLEMSVTRKKIEENK